MAKSIIDLEKCIDKEVRVKFQGGREGADTPRPFLPDALRAKRAKRAVARRGHPFPL